MVPKAANCMTHTAVLVALLLLPTTAVFSASQCDQASTAAASQLRLARASQNSMDHSAHNENCDTVIKQFVDAVTARQAAATCEDSVSRQRALKILDAQIETFNERIADQSCGQ
jgi:hypothetical protein